MRIGLPPDHGTPVAMIGRSAGPEMSYCDAAMMVGDSGASGRAQPAVLRTRFTASRQPA
jgi:hypothetical protein